MRDRPNNSNAKHCECEEGTGQSAENEIYQLLRMQAKGSKHPERYILGKRHPDRAKQFKPFAALRGYEELVDERVERNAAMEDFSETEEDHAS